MANTTGQLWPPGAAISYIAPTPPSLAGGAYQNIGGAGATTLTAAFPAGVQDGDRLVLAMCTSDTSLGAIVTETIPGWTAITAKADQGTMTRAFYWAPYSAGLAAPIWSIAAARECAYAMVAIRGTTSTPSVTSTDLAASSTDVSAPMQALAGQNIWLRFYVRKDNLSTSVTPPADSTLVTGALGVAAGPSLHILAYSQTPTGNPMPAAAAVFSVASANGTGWSVSV